MIHVALFVAAAGFQLSADLHEVSNLKAMAKQFVLSAEHKKALAKNMFFTCPSDDQALYWIYGRNDYQNIPSLITTDNILQIGHIFFDSTLRSIESRRLLPDLKLLTTAMLKQAIARRQALESGPLAEAANRNVAYFGVADRLVGNNSALPPSAKSLVDRELALIESHAGFKDSAIFPYDLDYSQFIVRGHYTKSDNLKRYFRGMMWYGLVPFAVERLVNGKPVPATETVQQALLLVRDLADSKAQPRWDRIYGTTTLYAGKSNNLTPAQWSAIANRVFGVGHGVASYTNKAKISQFVAEAKKVGPPMIVAKRQQGNPPGSTQFRFMGQRAIPDSRILQELSEPDLRPFPSPLDIFSVMGNSRATQILDASPDRYNPKGWKDYKPTRAKLTGEIQRVDRAGWSRDLYWSWLDTLRTLAGTPARYPKFMKSPAWQDKSLYSALASWAELRHDTILYGLQSVAEMGSGDEEPPPMVKGYVEPNVALYSRTKSFVQQLATGLKSRGYLVPEVADQVAGFQDLLSFLIKVSDKELAGQRLTTAEYKRIRYLEGDLESLHNQIQVIASGVRQLSQDDLDIALVADVHTAYGAALEVAVGRADHIFAVVPIEGKQVLTRGTAFSYYEFLRPVSDRMTDEAWKKQLSEGEAPPRSAWIGSFFVPKPLKSTDE